MVATTTAALLPLPILQGERCLLRALVPADAPALRRACGRRRRSRATCSTASRRPTRLGCRRRGAAHEANSGAFGYVWAIVVDGAWSAASASCRTPAPASAATPRSATGSARRTGAAASPATRCARSPTGRFAAVPQLTRIYAPIFARNEGSQAVARKCGFVREGVLKQSAYQGRRGDRPRRSGPRYRTEIARRDADIGAALAATAASAMERA